MPEPSLAGSGQGFAVGSPQRGVLGNSLLLCVYIVGGRKQVSAPGRNESAEDGCQDHNQEKQLAHSSRKPQTIPVL